MGSWSATSTGGTFDDGGIHARIEVTTTDSAATTSVTIVCKAVAASGYSSSFIRGRASNTAAGGETYGDYSSYMSINGNTITCKTETVTVTRTTSAQNITYWAYIQGGGTGIYNGDYDKISVTATIPALASYTISYNGNKPSAASGTVSNVPSSQTKYYGKNLVLSTTKPTLSGYTFKGWATSATSTTVAYNPGATYTGNAALALYAIWSLDYVEPTIGSVTTFRCNSSGQEQADGTYAKVSITWSTDSNYAGSKCDISYKESSASSYGTAISVTLSGDSGTVEQIINGNFNVKKSYSIKAVLTDTHDGSDTAYGGIPVCFKFLQFLNGGTGLAIGKYVSEPNKIETTLPIKIQFSTITDNVTPSENIYDRNGVQFLDSNNTLLGWMGYASRTNGIQGNRIYAHRDDYYNGFNLNIKPDGAPEIGFENNDCKQAWLDALEPDVLFEGSAIPNTASPYAVTLSSSAANYNHMRIYYKYYNSNKPESSIEVYNPNGKYVNLFIGYAGLNSGLYWPAATDIYINGTAITRRYSFYTSASTTTQRTTASGDDTMPILILRVEAWNDEWWG